MTPTRWIRRALTGFALALLAASGAWAQLKTPTDWRWRTDTPAPVTENDTMPGDSWFYVAMPPGWHVTTRPGVLLYHPGHEAQGRFALESEVFLFPGEGQAEYGVFLAGHDVDAVSGAPAYLAFVLRRDGSAAVLRRTTRGVELIAPWTANAAIRSGADTAVKNLLRVEASAATIDFDVNGQRVLSVPRDRVGDLEGHVGLRVGPGLNLHVTTFDVTFRLAPPRPPAQ